MNKKDATEMQGGGAQAERKKLGALLEEVLEDTPEVDDMFLAKIRRMIKRDGEDTNFYSSIDFSRMVLGTFMTVIGWAMLNTCGTGTHTLNSSDAFYAAEISLINTLISGGVCAFICFLLKRHVVIGDQWKTPRYDIRSLCNGFLSGVCAVSAGAGVMKSWGALLTGAVQAFAYMLTCLIMQRVKFDDAMENYQVYGTASFTAMFVAVFFIPDYGIFWGSPQAGSILGIQLLGWAAVSVWTTVITWIYFFSFNRCRLLKLKKAQELIGLDALQQAKGKRIDIKGLIEALNEQYPDHRKKGC